MNNSGELEEYQEINKHQDDSKYKRKSFDEYFLDKLNKDLKLNKLYQKIIPIIQKINQFQYRALSLNPVYEHHKIKDINAQIKKENDIIQLILTKEILEIVSDVIQEN